MIAPFFIETQKKTGKIFCYYKIKSYFCIAFEKQRALSSAGSEHLPYKQRVGGSNPSTPTLLSSIHSDVFFVSTQSIDCIYYDCFIISVGFV